MKILVLNCGSSSLKYQLFDMTDESVMAKGLVEKIGLADSFLTHQQVGGKKVVIKTDIPDHTVGISLVIKALLDKDHGVLKHINEIAAIGHRIVHGGPNFHTSVLVNDDITAELGDLVELAPLHNGAAVNVIKICQELLPVPAVTVFDTSFHSTMPPSAYIYAIPYEYYLKYKVRRYGAHGTSHRYVSLRAAELMGKKPEELKIITCHLGNGSSIAAIDRGKVIDTSMGFTPLAGLVMGSRCGDIDPAIVPFLMERENISPHDMSIMMNTKCGLLGISNVSSDMRDIEKAAAEGNERAQLALDVFDKQALRFIGSYIAELNGLDAIIFTAGIGENGSQVRKNICKNFSYFGVKIDDEANQVRGKETEISTPDSKVKVFVIPTNEELMIARDTLKLIEK